MRCLPLTCLVALVLLVANAVAGSLTVHGGSPRVHGGGHANLHRLHEYLVARDQPLQVQPGSVQTLWFDQRLDHFNPAVRSTFKQRYYVNSQYATANGPIFIYIGGEAELTNTSIASGEIVEFAQQNGGMLLALEHRYYGQSQPFANLSTANLRWLSSRQALEDLATFINNMTVTNNWVKNSWFNVGGSYPGALSAWFRLKYPHLTVGALASSAPVLAKEDFYEYDQIVSRSAGEVCSAAIRNATAVVQAALGTMDPLVLKIRFGCQNITDNVGFLYVLADAVSYAIQYTSTSPGPRYQLLPFLCNTMEDPTYNQIDRFVNFTVGLFQRLSTTCDDFSTTENLLDNLSTDPSLNQRQWYYQSCTEFGYFQTAPAQNSLRSPWINVSYHLGLCQQAFGQALVPNVAATNGFYGGANPVGSMIYFANGALDPWQALSVLAPLNCCSTIQTTVIAGASHCSDLHSSNSQDPKSLTLARQSIAQFVRQALGLPPLDFSGASKNDIPLWIAVGLEAFFLTAFVIVFYRRKNPSSAYSNDGDVAVYQPIGD